MSEPTSASSSSTDGQNMLLFWGCFVALIATAFGFIVRAQIIGIWGNEFGLTETEKGEIFGVGLWPFAISIVLFSLVIDKIGYKTAMIFGFVCHVLSVIITISAKGYWGLYIGTLIVALGNGTVEAYINPVVATMFSREKTKWLNILHAGWPGGLVLGGILAIGLGDVSWKIKVGLILIPTIIYIFMLIGQKFPVHERVAAGGTYMNMLGEFGALGMLIVSWLIMAELGRVFGAWGLSMAFVMAAILAIAFGLYTRSLGRPMFIFLLLIMVPLATTELGTDSWITALMQPEMVKLNLDAGWVLVYTSIIMVVLRFFAGPIVHKLSPLGLLAVSAVLAAIGLVFLSGATGFAILLAATIYGIGKTFFWPTMLGVVAEQFPKGGALTLNATGAVGMLGVGVLGALFLGFFQDQTIDREMAAAKPEIHQQVMGDKASLFGDYKSVDAEKVALLSEPDQLAVAEIQDGSKKSTLKTVAIFPVIMFVGYLVLIFYFKS